MGRLELVKESLKEFGGSSDIRRVAKRSLKLHRERAKKRTRYTIDTFIKDAMYHSDPSTKNGRSSSKFCFILKNGGILEFREEEFLRDIDDDPFVFTSGNRSEHAECPFDDRLLDIFSPEEKVLMRMANPMWHSLSDPEKRLHISTERDRRICVACGEPILGKWHMGHLTPQNEFKIDSGEFLEGKDDYDNVGMFHTHCNQKWLRGTFTAEEMDSVRFRVWVNSFGASSLLRIRYEKRGKNS